MSFALQMFFDPAGEAAVRRMWERLERAGVPSLATRTHRQHRPHVTLAGAQRLALAGTAIEATRDLLGNELTLSTLGTFPGEQAVLLLGITVTAELLRTHCAVHAGIESASEDLWAMYRPGRWVPHCTLAIGLDTDQLTAAFARLTPFAAFTVRVTQTDLVDNETGEATRVG
jgi:2'-5' RNA ligase